MCALRIISPRRANNFGSGRTHCKLLGNTFGFCFVRRFHFFIFLSKFHIRFGVRLALSFISIEICQRCVNDGSRTRFICQIYISTSRRYKLHRMKLQSLLIDFDCSHFGLANSAVCLSATQLNWIESNGMKRNNAWGQGRMQTEQQQQQQHLYLFYYYDDDDGYSTCSSL